MLLSLFHLIYQHQIKQIFFFFLKKKEWTETAI